MVTDLNFSNRALFIEESAFHVSGIANTQNVRIRETESLRAVQGHDVHI